jgi:hypothetical protein
MMARRPEVVNLRDCDDFGRAGDVYIGRAVPQRGLPRSEWANPFHMRQEGQRDDVLERYARYVDGHLDAGAISLETLRDVKRLGCWCAPRRCHGDYLADLIARLPRRRLACRAV